MLKLHTYLNIREHTHTQYFILTVNNILVHRYLIRIDYYVTIYLAKCISLNGIN